VTLTRTGEPPVEVDVGIAPLIEALWALGIDTVASCEDGGTSAEGGLPAGLAWIGFSDEEHAGRFGGLSRGVISGAFGLDPEIREEAEAGGIPASTWLTTFPTSAIAQLAELVRKAATTSHPPPMFFGEPEPDVGRNESCWCASGKKFKRCHGG
jgi:hypothetical protein